MCMFCVFVCVKSKDNIKQLSSNYYEYKDII